MTEDEWSLFYLKTVRPHPTYLIPGQDIGWFLCHGEDCHPLRWPSPIGESAERPRGITFTTEQDALNAIEILKYYAPHIVKGHKAIKAANQYPVPEIGGYAVSENGRIEVTISRFSWEDLQGGGKS